MIIRDVTLKNFGLYQNEHTVDFQSVSVDKPITLIGGLNGRGKTTFLEAIILGLYGHRALKFLQDERIKYSKYLENHINKSTPLGGEVSIAIVLADSKANGGEIGIKRYWYNNPDMVTERFEAYKNGLYDKYLSRNWDYFVEEILPLNISRFFFFDGEKISQIADEESFANVKDSIRALLGLTTIDQLESDVTRLIKRIQQLPERETTEYTLQIQSIYSRMESNEENAKAAYDEMAHYSTLITKAQSLHEREQELFWQAGGNLGLDREKIAAEKELQSHKLKEQLQTIDEYIQEVSSPLLLCRPLLMRTMERAKKEEQAQLNRLSEDFIAKLKEMIIQSDYSDKRKRQILQFLEEAAHQYVSFAAAPLSRVLSTETIYQLRKLLDSADERLTLLHKILSSFSETQKHLLQIEDHLSREVNGSDAQKHWNAMLGINETIIANEVNRRVALERYERLGRERTALERQYARILASNMQHELDLGESQRMIHYAGIVKSVMHEFKRRIQAKRVAELQTAICRCFRSMMGKESMIRDVEINADTLDIKLIDYTGGELIKTQLSAGEKQIFAVSILWGLAQCSGYDMPVIIDTPLGRLDSQHRANFVEGYLPYAGRQVIVLSTDEEIDDRYFKLIQKYTNTTYTLIYDDNACCTTIVPGYFGGEQA